MSPLLVTVVSLFLFGGGGFYFGGPIVGACVIGLIFLLNAEAYHLAGRCRERTAPLNCAAQRRPGNTP